MKIEEAERLKRNDKCSERSCTDVFFLILFSAFMFGWAMIATYVSRNGDISRLFAPMDSRGRQCGHDEAVRRKPYLFFFDLTECTSLWTIFLYGCPTKQVCVKECPTENWFSWEVISEELPTAKRIMDIRRWDTYRKKFICESDNVTQSIDSVSRLREVIRKKICAPYYLRSVTVGRSNVCLPLFVRLAENSSFLLRSAPNGAVLARSPDVEDNNWNVSLQTLSRGASAVELYFASLEQSGKWIVEDTAEYWSWLVAFGALCVLLALFFVTILARIAYVAVWTTIATVLALLAFCTVASYARAAAASENIEDDLELKMSVYSKFTLYGQWNNLMEQPLTWKIFALAFASLFVVFTLLVGFLRSRIMLSVTLIKEGSRAVSDVKSSFFIPPVIWCLRISLFACFLYVFLFIQSLGNAEYKIRNLVDDVTCSCAMKYEEGDWCVPHQFEEQCHPIDRPNDRCNVAKCQFYSQRWTSSVFYLHVYNLTASLWVTYFIRGMEKIILAGCFASWYWTRDKRKLPFLPIFSSSYITIRYHLGSVAFGSLLVATVVHLRTVLKYTGRSRSSNENGNALVKSLPRTIAALFWFIRKFLIFISDNGYIMCAMHGRSFCQSARTTFALITRNAFRVVVLNWSVHLIIGLCKVIIASVTIALSAYIFYSLPLHYPWLPVIIVALSSWLICCCIFGVYSTAIDTIFLCFLEDCELNDGSGGKPYYMSPTLECILKRTELQK